jgi:hypothetical protein
MHVSVLTIFEFEIKELIHSFQPGPPEQDCVFVLN